MAVQQNKKSHSKKGMRRSHDRVAKPTVIYCSCGAPTVPHSVCPSCGKQSPITASYCSSCGAKLTPDEEKAE